MISNDSLNELRDKIKGRLSPKRFQHTLGVESFAALIGEYCLPDRIFELRAAALLHDVAKEIPIEEQIELLSENGIKITADELNSPQIIHSLTAPYVVINEFPEFAIKVILSAVEKHTLGDVEMSIFDEIIFLSDYVEVGRTYDSCVSVRKFLLDNFRDSQISSNIQILHKACLMVIDNTIHMLNKKNQTIHPRMLKAKDTISSFK